LYQYVGAGASEATAGACPVAQRSVTTPMAKRAGRNMMFLVQ
jgi:hypothetical protein